MKACRECQRQVSEQALACRSGRPAMARRDRYSQPQPSHWSRAGYGLPRPVADLLGLG